MTTEKGLAIIEDRQVAIHELETRFAMAVRQRELLETYIRERLKPAKHFYKVDDDPARKPSLTKEGAELICLPHGLKPQYEILFWPQQPPMDESPYQVTVNCELRRGESFEGQGVGSASSMITRRDGERVQRQKDPGLRHNSTLKMACKSAYIAATLNATAASEFFTQDLEDDHTGSPEKSQTAEHWCSEHKIAFFKSKKMASYAHPIGDTGKWCHEHKEKSAPKTESKPVSPESQADVEKDIEELWGPPPATNSPGVARTAAEANAFHAISAGGSNVIDEMRIGKEPSRRDQIFAKIKENKPALRTNANVRSWLVGFCKIPVEQVDDVDDLSWWEKVKKDQGWTD